MRERALKEWWLMSVGGVLYGLIELCWRGRTHWSMVIVGGICFRLIGWIHQRFRGVFSTVVRCALCAVVISLAELAAGLMVNRQFQVWNYSELPLNLWGQICPIFSLLWGVVSLLATPVFNRCKAQIQPLYKSCGQQSASGHISHFGERAVQTSLPNNTSR